MRDAGGYSIITAPGERAVENDLENCAHCQAVQFLRAGLGGNPEIMIFRADGTHYLREARRCSNCWKFVCPKPGCNQDCVPFEKKLDQEERAARFICT